MPKKITNTATARLEKNTEKGGSWLCTFAIVNESNETTHLQIQAWSNAGAGKRWVKSLVIEHTNKKSMKMAVTMQDEAGKPTLLLGTLPYQVNA
jgi:hypothetical protein